MSAPIILFRCDASPALGLGHLMRCIALAAALRARGARPVFVVRVAAESTAGSDPRVRLLDGAYANLSQRLFESIALPLTPPQFDETLDEVDASALIRAIREVSAHAVIVDHYGANEHYLESLRPHAPVLGVVDDLADRPLHMCDWVLNPSPAAIALPYQLRSDAVALLGPTFALLRPEFLTRSAQSRVKSGVDSDSAQSGARIVLTLGGGDQTARLQTIVEALQRSPRKLHVRCIGRQPQLIKEPITAPGVQIEWTDYQPDIAPLLAWADVVVTAGGATCWELCALGVPQIAIALEANQEPNVAGIAAIGAGISLGRWNASLTPAMAATAVEMLLASRQLQARMSHAGSARVDGCGAGRAADSLLARIDQSRSRRPQSTTNLPARRSSTTEKQSAAATCEVSHA